MPESEITRRIEFDAGHRIPSHESKCCHAHGHRYVLEATARGAVKPERGQTDDGMVIDFGQLKAVMMDTVHAAWDHAFLVSANDRVMRAALNVLGEKHRTVVLPFVPTVENMVAECFRLIDGHLDQSIKLVRVRLYETPNCWADYTQQF